MNTRTGRFGHSVPIQRGTGNPHHRRVPDSPSVVARPAQGQLPASSLREIDDRWAWPARHLAVNRLDRADQLGLDLEGGPLR
jgi:hypothetical protein